MRKHRLLLVDDEPPLLLTYGKILERNGYEVATADSAINALARLQEREFNALICDLTLGGKPSGFEVIDLASVLYPSIQTILLTGYADAAIETEAAAKGAQVLLKPVQVPELLAAISRALESRRETG